MSQHDRVDFRRHRATYYAVPRHGWSRRRWARAGQVVKWFATLALYVVICVEIFVAGILLLPPPVAP